MDAGAAHGTRRRVSRLLPPALLALAALLAPPAALADGIKMPERAYKKLPAIPSQRAFLSFRDGVETLIVESTFEGEGRRFGWLLPVPAKPTAFGKVSPGFLKTLSFVLQPRIQTKGPDTLPAAVFSLFLVGWAFFVLFGSPRRPIAFWTLIIGSLIVGFFLLTFSALGAKSAAPGGPGAGPSARVRVLESVSVGDYDVSVLETPDTRALDAWLEENGFLGLDARGRSIVALYIAEKWKFVAAKIRRDAETGAGAPHPLSITFPSKAAVYPMRLTALAGSDVYLEVFVAADGSASAPGMDREISDILGWGFFHPSGEDKGRRTFSGRRFRAEIGHPDAQRYLWDGCVLTKFSGTLAPSDMDADIPFEIGSAEPFRQVLFSEESARGFALRAGMLAWIVLGLAAFLAAYRWLGEPVDPARFAGCVLLPALAVSLAAGIVAYARLPTVEIGRTVPGYRLFGQQGISFLHEVKPILDPKGLGPLAYPGGAPADLERFVLERFRAAGERNLVTGEALKAEDSPGNFVVVREGPDLIVRFFDSTGAPQDWRNP